MHAVPPEEHVLESKPGNQAVVHPAIPPAHSDRTVPEVFVSEYMLDRAPSILLRAFVDRAWLVLSSFQYAMSVVKTPDGSPGVGADDPYCAPGSMT